MKIYLMDMYRFGECFQVAAETKEKGFSALKKKYIDLYKRYNDERPTKEEIETMLNCIEITEMELNKVFDPCE